MTDQQQYSQFYRALNLNPDCTWEELRNAYRKLVRLWHPDRYAENDDKKAYAAEKIKEINTAFSALEKYFKEHDKLPSVDLSEVRRQTIRPSTGVQFRTNKQTKNVRESRPASNFSIMGKIALLLVFVFPIYHLAMLKDDTRSGTGSHTVGTEAVPPALVIHNKEGNPLTAANISGQSILTTFTYGSTKGDVYAAQGEPSSANDDVWHYGKSKVYFVFGRVSHWENQIDSPLRISLEPRTETRNQNSIIKKGSTKAEVLSIQGQPLRQNGNVWYYGSSRIQFKGDHVVDWYDSPLSPLQIKEQF